MRWRQLPLVVGLLFAILCIETNADIGPKPTIKFVFLDEFQNVVLMLCDEADCSDAHPLERLGPQHFGCFTDKECSALAYGFAPYLQLVVTDLSGTTLKSAPFRKDAFEAHFTVTVDSGEVIVQEESSPK